MKKIVKKVGVDAGIIMIADEDYYNRFKSKKFEEDLSYKIEVPIGLHSVQWKIPNTWNGTVSGEGLLQVTSGTVIVSDPCYLVGNHKEWMKWLDETDYCNKPHPGTIILDKMGGDGCYNVHLSIRPANATLENILCFLKLVKEPSTGETNLKDAIALVETMIKEKEG